MNYLPETLIGKTITAEQLKTLGFTNSDETHWTKELLLPNPGALVKLVPEITLEDNKLTSLILANAEDLKTLPDYKINILLNRLLDNLEQA